MVRQAEGHVAILGMAVLVGAYLLLTAPPEGQPRSSSSALFIRNAKIWSGEDESNDEADSILVIDDLIVAVGLESSPDMQRHLRQHFGTLQELDGEGRMLVVPGFIDSHVHFLISGCGLASVHLRDVASKASFIDRIAQHARTRPSGAWIREGDWDHEKWGGELPTHGWIDDVTPDHFVFVCRLDGHMCLANAKALAAANITKDSPEVAGGTITRDPVTGEPTGILKDRAMELVWAVIPKPSDEEEDACLEAAMSHVLKHGVTSIHHMAYTWNDIAVFKRAWERKKLRTRIYAAVPLSSWEQLAEEKQRLGIPVEQRTWGDDWFRMGNLKAFVDGSLGSHTAYMFEPFADTPDQDTSLMLATEEELSAWTLGADKAGLHLSIHAIGDKANHLLLDAYERLIQINGQKDRRVRIEHAQHLREEDQLRLAKMGVIASMQPYHVSDDGRWADRVLGPKRTKEAWPFRSLMDKNVTLAFGSDWFVAPPVPVLGIGAAATRLTLQQIEDLDIHQQRQHASDVDTAKADWQDGWVPEQKITVREALRAYTVHGAYASFEEDKKGRIRPGMLADLVLLDRDITQADTKPHGSMQPRDAARHIWNTRVEATIVGGRLLYQKSQP